MVGRRSEIGIFINTHPHALCRFCCEEPILLQRFLELPAETSERLGSQAGIKRVHRNNLIPISVKIGWCNCRVFEQPKSGDGISSMKLHHVLTALVAFTAGLIGGWASRFLPGPAVAEGRYGTVRAQRFELVDQSMRATAFLGTTDGMKNTALVFLDRQRKEHAAFGVWAKTATPYMVMKGQEGMARFSVELAYRTERPVIAMRDEKEYRMQLGFLPTDFPSPGDNSWGLIFHDHDSPHSTLSAIGMEPEVRKVPLSEPHPKVIPAKMRGFISVRDGSGIEWVCRNIIAESCGSIC